MVVYLCPAILVLYLFSLESDYIRSRHRFTVKIRMPKAVLSMESGATVVIEGSQEEVASIIARLGGRCSQDGKIQLGRGKATTSKPRSTLGHLLLELIEEGFFGEPKELGQVAAALSERGHFYPVTTLSPAMLRLVRKKKLRRMKEKGRWAYVEQ